MAQNKVIEFLQYLVTDLSQQADGHMVQSRIFASKGFSKLADKYAEHAAEERGYVEKAIDRILDLGGEVKNGEKKETPTYTDPVEWVKYDLQVSKDGLAQLKAAMPAFADDFTTYDFMKDYYKDEEEDMYWGESQLELIETIGVQNWILQQL